MLSSPRCARLTKWRWNRYDLNARLSLPEALGHLEIRCARRSIGLNAPHFSTKQRILGAAEELFARHGFAGASLRQVTSAANVNLAAVNYHFGSKENLINEVFRRRLDELNAERLQALQAVQQKPQWQLEDVLEAFIRPALALSLDRQGGAAFVRVLARAYAEHNERLRKFLSDNYGHVLKEFASAFGKLLPDLGKEELYWRLDIVSGALTYAMADFGVIKRRNNVSEHSHHDLAALHLVKFAAAGLRDP
jgi:AcrR family transcriptional regulator